MIFIVGGTTYEEARSVALYNAANPGVRFFLGGSVVLNSKRYALLTISLLAMLHSVITLFGVRYFLILFLLGAEYLDYNFCSWFPLN